MTSLKSGRVCKHDFTVDKLWVSLATHASRSIIES